MKRVKFSYLGTARFRIFLFACIGSCQLLMAQNISVKGMITDSETGEPLPGVSVYDPVSKKGTVSDANGKYVFSNVSAKAKIEFTFVGYGKVIKSVDNRKEINVKMVSTTKDLDEVVVVGYGLVKKSEMTSSIAKVDETAIEKTPVTSLEQALQGNAAGVLVINTSAEPGGEISVRIRGGSSILAGNTPLYVIDGFPMESGDLSMINPSDIVSMEVLKDASATAIYGSQGANGVIMITTKQGKEGRLKVDFSTRLSLSGVRHMIPVLDGPLYMQYNNIGRLAMGSSMADMRPDTARTRDYQKEIIKPNTFTQEYNLSINGGTKNMNYLLSAGFIDQPGLLRNSDYQRLSLRGKFGVVMAKNLNMQLGFSHSSTKRHQAGGGDSGATLRTLMLRPLESTGIFKDGLYIDEETGEVLNANSEIANSLYTTDEKKNTMTDFNMALNWTIINGLVFRTTAGYRINQNQNDKYVPREIYLTQNNIDKNNKATRSTSASKQWTNANTLTYMRTINKSHNITAMIAQEWKCTDNDGFSAAARGFETDDFFWNDLGGAKIYDSMSSSKYKYSMLSFFGRLMYGYKGKYLATATVRADGSSRFGQDSKWGCFPSVSAAWVATKEDFLKEQDVLSNLKLRLSYGLTGNDRIGQYKSWSTLSSTKILVNGVEQVGYRTNNIGDKGLKWERNESWNIGLDLAFLKNRIALTVDVYKKIARDMLYNKTLPSTTGYTSVTTNIGRVDNEGIEFEFVSRNLTGPFKWTTNFTAGYNKNEIKNLGGDDNLIAFQMTNTVNTPITYLVVGSPIGTFKGYQMAGVYKDWNDVYSSASVWADGSLEARTQPGYLKYVDQNGDGVIDENDKVVLGHAQPSWTVGFTNTFSYKNFELSVFFTGAFGNKIVNTNKAKLERYRGSSDNQTKYVLDGWRPRDPNTGDPGYYSGDRPRAVYNTDYATNLTDLFLEDGDYFRLKTLSLAYNLPKKALQKMRMRNCRLQISGVNLLTFTKYTGMDPESSSSLGDNNMKLGIDQSSYPASKSVVFSLAVGF
ncbi:SusC/RagA family TonB-linked outer membrane protein [Coprobacter sp.]